MNNSCPRHVRSATSEGPPARQEPWTDLDPPEPSYHPAETARPAMRRRITQAALDRMAELRRQGATHQDIAAELGCSERTVRRYAGKVERQLVAPPARVPEDVEDQRAELLDRYTEFLHSAWQRFPSVALLDESIGELDKRLRAMRPETIGLVATDRRMRSHLLIEVVAPLFRDYETFLQVEQLLQRVGDPRPLAWSRDAKWKQDDADEGNGR